MVITFELVVDGSPRLELYKEKVLERSRTNSSMRPEADPVVPTTTPASQPTTSVTVTKASWAKVRGNLKTIGSVISAFKSSAAVKVDFCQIFT